MKQIKVAVAALITLSMTLGMAGCAKGGTSDAKNNDGKIKIAVAAPVTGDNSEYGIGFANAAQLMIDQWNSQKKFPETIELETFDDKNSPEEGVSVANKIISAGDIKGVIGHFSSGVCMAAATIYQENKLVEISPSASHPDYSGIGDYIFRNNTIINHEAEASIKIATEKFNKKKIGIISIKTDWGVSTAKIVKDLIAQRTDGVTVVAHEEVIEGSDDYRPLITKLNEADSEVVICVGMYNLVAPVAKQYKEINPDIKIVGFSNAYSQQLLELGGEYVEDVAFPVIFFASSEDPKIKKFVEEYKGRFGSDPSALTAQAYDSTGILLTALEKLGDRDLSELNKVISELEYDGVTGKTKFDANGDVKKEFTDIIIKDHKFTNFN